MSSLYMQNDFISYNFMYTQLYLKWRMDGDSLGGIGYKWNV